MVETANGGLVEVSMKGTVKVLMNDTFQHNKTVMVYLNEVLHVPLLSRRLFSVAVVYNRCHVLPLLPGDYRRRFPFLCALGTER
jgi:hypothetical protein